jgi:hypothetical protein
VTDLVLLISFNALAFWKGGPKKFLFVPAAIGDIIYGFIYAVSTNTIPSVTYFMGLIIVLYGCYCFFGEFIWRGIMGR